MGAWLFYIFESTVCLTILYFLFRIFFRADTLFRTNRLLLLIGTLCCMSLPFVQVDMVDNQLWRQPFTAVRDVLMPESYISVETEQMIERVSARAEAVEDTGGMGKEPLSFSSSYHLSLAILLGTIYLVGAGSTLLFFLFSIGRMLGLVCRCSRLNNGEHEIFISSEKIPSFSWGNMIVLSREDYDRNAEEVLLHERMHLRYCHTFDLLWMEALIVLHWFNPAIWLLMRDLRELHEYEADNGVLTHGIDATQYQLLLVKKSVGTRLYSMASGFNHSKLKNRINMMLKKRTNSWARLKLLLFVPMAAGALIVFAQPEVKKTVAQMVKPESMAVEVGLQDSICCDEWGVGMLEQYFQRKTEEAYPGKKADSWSEESLWQFFINMNDQLMLGNEKVQDVEQLRLRWADILRESYQEAVEENDRLKLPKLCIRYDRGATVFAVRSCLRAFKEAYEQVHDEICTEFGDATKVCPDSLLPIAVYKITPRIYKNQAKYRTPVDVPLPIEVSFFGNGKQLSEKLKNITLDELRQTVERYKSEVRNNGLEICLKVDENAKMSVMNDAKLVIKEATK